MVQIPLIGGGFALIDDEDLPKIGGVNWRRYEHRPGLFYARGTFERRTRLMHQLLVDYRGVDHINGDGLDNRRANLRPYVHGQNQQNMKSTKGGSSRFKGVSWRKNRWDAYITVGGRKVHLGRFLTEEEAAHAYNTAAEEHFGDFARANEV